MVSNETNDTNRTAYLGRRQEKVRSESRTKRKKKRWELEDRLRLEKQQKKGEKKK